jgi:uncharacterized protein involved in outer membrane biogenesis
VSETKTPVENQRWLDKWAAHRQWAYAMLILLALMWAMPMGLKWLLVQQLQHVFKRDVSVQAVRLHPLSLSIEVQGLSVQNTQGAEWVGWERLTLDVSAQSFRQRALVLDALTLIGPRVSVVHLGQGTFDFSDLLGPSKTSSRIALPPFVLHEVRVSQGRITLEDRPHQQTHTIEDFTLALPLFSSVNGNNGMTLSPELSAIVNGAPVHVGATLQPLADAPSGVLTLRVTALDLTPLQAYVSDVLPLRLASGKLSADLKLQLTETEAAGRTALLLNGTAKLDDFDLRDVHDRLLATFENLSLTLSQADVLVRHCVFSDVVLAGPRVSVRINTAGQLNWLAALSPAPQRQANAALSPAPAAVLQVKRFSLRGGSVDMNDDSVKPAVQTRITDMNVVMNGFSTQPHATADLMLNAKLGVAAPLDVKASLQPLAVKSFLDAKLAAKNVDLARLSGYAAKYLGYPIDKGKLSIEGRYRIEDQQLQANTHVFIDQLTLGEQVPSPHAIDAPLSLGVSLLKNSSGQIDMDLPVSGAVDAPEFSFGGLVVQTIGNVLVKVVTAPVRAIGSLLGRDKQDE